MRSQIFEAIRQPAGEAPAAATHDQHIEQLLLNRKVALEFARKGRAAEEVGQQQAEQPVPVAQHFALIAHPMALQNRARLYLATTSSRRANDGA